MSKEFNNNMSIIIRMLIGLLVLGFLALISWPIGLLMGISDNGCAIPMGFLGLLSIICLFALVYNIGKIVLDSYSSEEEERKPKSFKIIKK
jgi:uncharacterized membrane protein